MPVRALFPTLIYTSPLQRAGQRGLNRELLKEAGQIRAQDAAGQRWSEANYPGGYTSYGSLCQLHRLSSTFALLERKLNRHVQRFAESLHLDLDGRELAMTDCWLNVMGRHAAHSLHLHPLSTISGTYYVKTPTGCAGLKLEDPRLDRFMASPARAGSARPWVTIPAEAGKLVLFESWLRHEVPAERGSGERISISFNYNWF
jgi:uncharacterized protein (TIGR02466 family)